MFKDLGELRGSGAVELASANLRTAQRRWPEADHAFDEAVRIAQEIGNRPMEASVLFNRAQMMKRRNQRDEARNLLTEARRLFTELGNAARVARCDQELQDLTA